MNLELTDRDLYDVAAPVEGDLPSGFIRAMFGLMRKYHGIGLAAPQVGYSLQVFVTDVPSDKPRVFINPTFISYNHHYELSEDEGCLSFPGKVARIRRPYGVTIHAHDKRGRFFALDAVGMDARCIQHEYDHLQGKTIFGGRT